MVVRVKENCQHPNKILKKKRKIKLERVTWESPRKNSAKKAYDKIKEKHHITVTSRA
jgi:hypothetical protein